MKLEVMKLTKTKITGVDTLFNVNVLVCHLGADSPEVCKLCRAAFTVFNVK